MVIIEKTQYDSPQEVYKAHLSGDVSLEYDCISDMLCTFQTVTLTYPTYNIEIDLDELLGDDQWALLTTPLQASQISAHKGTLSIQDLEVDATDWIYAHSPPHKSPTAITLNEESQWVPTRMSDERCIAQYLTRNGYDEDHLWATVPENCHECGTYFAPNTPECHDLQDHDYICSDCREEDDDDC